MELINNNNYFAVGNYFPPDSHINRVQSYRDNKKIFKGHHHEVFKKNFYGNDRARELLYISVNLAGIVCKKSADFLFGEDLKVLSGTGDNSSEQLALDRFVEENHINTLLYENALSNSYSGDAFIKIRYGQEYAGELPPELDEPRIIIENVNPANVFPECYSWDKKKIRVYHIAVPIYSEELKTWIICVESHSAGKISYGQYTAVPQNFNSDNEPERFKITGTVEGSFVEVATGVSIPLVVHIPNFTTAEDWQGIDDLTELHPLLDEINNRISQISDILDKHSNPAMAVPSGLLGVDEEGNPNFRVAVDKVFEVMGKDDIIPQYVTWNGQLQEAYMELDRLIDMVLTVSEVPAVAIGKGDSGTSGSSGLAIKWRMNSLLAKINRKKQYYIKGLKQVFYIAQSLELALGISNTAPAVPVLVFSDGLPKDEMEQATIMNMRTGGAKTLSQKSAIMQLNGFNEEQAEAEIERINQEEESTQEVVNPSFLGEEENPKAVDSLGFNSDDSKESDTQE